MEQVYSFDYVKMDGTRGSLDGGTLESAMAKVAKIRSEGGRIIWASDPAILKGETLGHDESEQEPEQVINNSLVLNNSRRENEMCMMPVMNFADPRFIDMEELGVEGDLESNVMPVMNFIPHVPKAPASNRKSGSRRSAGEGSRHVQDGDMLPLPSMSF